MSGGNSRAIGGSTCSSMPTKSMIAPCGHGAGLKINVVFYRARIRTLLALRKLRVIHLGGDNPARAAAMKRYSSCLDSSDSIRSPQRSMQGFFEGGDA